MEHPLRKLVTKGKRNIPFTSEYLSQFGVTAQSVAAYVKHGWLKRLQRGVFVFPNDELSVYGVVKYIEELHPQIHVAAKTALSWQGVVHNVDFEDSVVLFGEDRFSLPDWSASWPMRYVRTRLFSSDVDVHKTLKPVAHLPLEVQASIPERAILELLYDVGNGISLEEARNLFEGFRYPRKKILGALLASCQSKKVTRLFAMWAKETQLLDVEKFYDEYNIQRGHSSFWSVKIDGNTKLSLHP